MKNYYDLHLKFDVLLDDRFEKFRNNSLKSYGLRPSHYLNATSLSWDVILKMTKIKLELIPDLYMYLFFEEGAIGRISHISNRYSKANKKEPRKEKFNSSLTDKKLVTKNMNMFLMFGTNLK